MKSKSQLIKLNIGQTFGHWTVISDEPIFGNHRETKWLCECKCGTKKYVPSRNLRRGDSKSCGCMSREFMTKRLMIDISGQKFGRLTAIKPAKRRGNWVNVYWHVKCDCGNEKIVDGKSLRNGRTKSCGCYHSEVVSKNNMKHPKETVITKLMANYKQGAKKRKINFDLSRDDFDRLIHGKCFYCRKPPSNIFAPKRFKNPEVHPEPYFYNGIDRIDSSDGYKRDNCVSCCAICNMAKRDMGLVEFMQWIERVYKTIKFDIVQTPEQIRRKIGQNES